ncbi:hypothetical protein niasHT_031107 [Heterodera trifolii]|uniref:BTB domain-containing protein n=1 Tax=Heterodera trifolii TaxID=157864 RepID=A0ABD2IRB5_9BILA
MSLSVVDRMKRMLSTGEDADVHFLVGEGEEKERVAAHKVILKHASEVFEAMFRFDSQNQNVENASANCVVEVPDVDAAAFKVMLSFIYADDLSELDGDNAMAVLYAAKKYNIAGLVVPSLQIPISKLHNVFFAYAQAQLFELENFAYHCLFYIDENADTLLNSVAFLQIDQKTLCEILSRDELQISGEISIWNACSSEKRRANLGPALFKIRFPLVSKEEFSKNIVPSGVLTVEEVIGIYQFHCHPNLSMDSELYSLKFPRQGRISDRTEGTLKLEIEKMSEFAGEAVGSCRYSKTVHIRGLPFEIFAKINATTENDENFVGKWLGIFLWCTAPTEDSNWSCNWSATFRIVAQNKGAENCAGKRIDNVFDSKSNSWGFPTFIAFWQLMDPRNGFYDKNEDKVTLAIDVIVGQAEMDRPISADQSKSKGTLFMDIEKVSQFAREIIWSERKSETVTCLGGLPWKISVQIFTIMGSAVKCLSLFLCCTAPKEDENWRAECSAKFRIVSQMSGVGEFRKEFEHTVFNSETNCWGFPDFITFAELMDPGRGLYDREEDKVTLAIDVTVMKERKGTKRKLAVGNAHPIINLS